MLNGWRWTAWRILRRSKRTRNLDDVAFEQHVSDLRWSLLAGKTRAQTQCDIYAAAVEAIRRSTGMTLRPVQIGGALGLTTRSVVEMQTGEGKTLTAVPAVSYFAMHGKGCHVVTSNPYLAERDAELLRPIYELMGLTVGCVLPSLDQRDRRAAYDCDIVYGTASEFGFDFLRDRLQIGAGNPDEDDHGPDRVAVQRGLYAAVIDEADSVLIDEASTPLIIGTEVEATPAVQTLYNWANDVASTLDLGEDFTVEPARMQCYLTEEGARKIVIHQKPYSLMDTVNSEEIFEQIEKSLVAHRLLLKDRDYMIKDGELILVSGSTGRRLTGRKWQKGLHQAVESKEQLEISSETRTSSRITIQEFFGRYAHLSGMTGTARTVRREVKRFYRMQVRVLPTHRKCMRRKLSQRVFASLDDKHAAILQSIEQETRQGRPVLVGTPSVEASEAVAEKLHESGVDFKLLNADQDAEEAEIVARAGDAAVVTIATNMAGRGTDIKLSEEVKEAGGLHVIVTETHASRRIDRQLVGRAARQGEPGSFQFLLSLEDEIWSQLPALRPSKMWLRATLGRSVRPFASAQKRLERKAEKQRSKMFKSAGRYRQVLRDAGVDLYLESVE